MNGKTTTDYVSTREAAAQLGIALSTVQAWVESGVLPAWKTAGGHRRIPRQAIDAWLHRQSSVQAGGTNQTYRILAVDDDPVQLELYRHKFSEWQLPIELLTATDGFEGLILVGRHAPHLLIVDLAMPGMDGFEMIRRLNDYTGTHALTVMVATALSTEMIEARGGLPESVLLYFKPLPFAALRPFISHLVSRALLTASH